MLGWGTGELPGAHCLKPHFSGAPFSGAPFLAPEPNGPKTTEEIPLARSELSLLRPECICGHPCIRLIAHPLPTPLRSGLGTTRARVSVCEPSAPACAFLFEAPFPLRLRLLQVGELIPESPSFSYRLQLLQVCEHISKSPSYFYRLQLLRSMAVRAHFRPYSPVCGFRACDGTLEHPAPSPWPW